MTRLLSFFFLVLAGLFGIVSLVQAEHGSDWSKAMFGTLAVALVVLLPGLLVSLVRPFVGKRVLPTRPRRSSTALLRAPTAWGRVYRALGYWALLCLVGALLDNGLAAVLLLCTLPALLVVLLWQLIHPGAAAERRMLAQQLACGLDANVPLPELLERLRVDALALQVTRTGPLPVVLDWLAFDLRCGAQFAMAVSNHAYFPAVWGPLLTAGERGGQLPDCLRMLARFESNQPKRTYLLRALLSLPIVLFLAVMTSQVALEPTVLELPAVSSRMPLMILLGLAFVLALGGLGAPWIRWSGLRDRMQRLPWIWPLARQEEQLMALTAMLAGSRIGCDATEIVELGRAACTHSVYRACLDPERAAAGDRLGQLLAPAFSPEVVALVDYGDLVEGLEAAQSYVEGRLDEERLRLERRFLQVFQLLTGLLVLICAFTYFMPMESFYLRLIQESL